MKDEIKAKEGSINDEMKKLGFVDELIELWDKLKKTNKKIVLILGETKAGKTLLANYLQGKRPEGYTKHQGEGGQPDFIPLGEDINQGVGDGVSSTTSAISIAAETDACIYLDSPGIFDYEDKKNDDVRQKSIMAYWYSLESMKSKIKAILLVINGELLSDTKIIINCIRRHGKALKNIYDYSRIIPVITKISNSIKVLHHTISQEDYIEESQMNEKHLYFESDDDFNANQDKIKKLKLKNSNGEVKIKKFPDSLLKINTFFTSVNYSSEENQETDKELQHYTKPLCEISRKIAHEILKKQLDDKQGWNNHYECIDIDEEVEQAWEEMKPDNENLKEIHKTISLIDILGLKKKLLCNTRDKTSAEKVNPFTIFLKNRNIMFFHPSSKTFVNELEDAISKLDDENVGFDFLGMSDCFFDANENNNRNLLKCFKEDIDNISNLFGDLALSYRKLKRSLKCESYDYKKELYEICKREVIYNDNKFTSKLIMDKKVLSEFAILSQLKGYDFYNNSYMQRYLVTFDSCIKDIYTTFCSSGEIPLQESKEVTTQSLELKEVTTKIVTEITQKAMKAKEVKKKLIINSVPMNSTFYSFIVLCINYLLSDKTVITAAFRLRSEINSKEDTYAGWGQRFLNILNHIEKNYDKKQYKLFNVFVGLNDETKNKLKHKGINEFCSYKQALKAVEELKNIGYNIGRKLLLKDIVEEEKLKKITELYNANSGINDPLDLKSLREFARNEQNKTIKLIFQDAIENFYHYVGINEQLVAFKYVTSKEFYKEDLKRYSVIKERDTNSDTKKDESDTSLICQNISKIIEESDVCMRFIRMHMLLRNTDIKDLVKRQDHKAALYQDEYDYIKTKYFSC